MKRKARGLFLNTNKAKCSIHESGKMVYECLMLSNKYSLDYLEIDEKHRTISGSYDFYIFNYHQITMGWLNLDCIKELPGFKTTIVLEVDIDNPFCMCPNNIFDAYLVLDPTIRDNNKNVYAFPRPLEKQIEEQNNFSTIVNDSSVPIIGTFGFYNGNSKGFDKLIDAVNKEFDEAVVRINALNPDWGGNSSEFDKFVNYLKNYPTKKNVKIIITSNYLNKKELIDWCASNTLNAFFYNRHGAGLSATTDQAITSGRPLAVSTGYTFRHIHQYIKPYPYVSLRDSINNGVFAIKKIQEEWSQLSFIKKFEDILDKNIIQGEKKNKLFVLPTNKFFLFKKTVGEFFPLWMVSNLIKIKKLFLKNNINKINDFIRFVHPVLRRFGSINKDILIDLFFYQKKIGNSLKEVFNENIKDSRIDVLHLNEIGKVMLILKSNDWNKNRPSVIVIKYGIFFETVRFFMENNDFMNIYNDENNMIFVDKFSKDNNILKVISWRIKF